MEEIAVRLVNLASAPERVGHLKLSRDLPPRSGRHVGERMVPDGRMVLPKALEHSLDLPMAAELDLVSLHCEAAILGQGRQDAIDVLAIDACEIFRRRR